MDMLRTFFELSDEDTSVYFRGKAIWKQGKKYREYQARDLNLLSAHYKITDVQPVDMFPHTHHVENVCALTIREKLQ